MRTIAIVNHKGGTGKTTTAVNLAACLAEVGRSVLLVDLDPHANATTHLGVHPGRVAGSTADVLLRRLPLRRVWLATQAAGLRLAPANLFLVGAEVRLTGLGDRGRRALRDALETGETPVDYALIDCAPPRFPHRERPGGCP